MHKRKKDSLLKNTAACFCKNRSNNINKLSKAGNLDSVTMTKKRNHHWANHKCIFKIINILKKIRCYTPFFKRSIIWMIPYIPFIKGEVNCFLWTLFCLNIIAGTDNGINKFIKLKRFCKKALNIVRLIVIILMKRYVINTVISNIKTLNLPLTEGCWISAWWAAQNSFNAWISPLHNLGCFKCSSAVFNSRFCTHLPSSVHLIAKAPQLYIPRVIITVSFS